MAYATQQDLIDRYSEEELIERTDRTGANAVNATVVAAALESAAATIDLHLRGRYRVPLTGVIPREIVLIACSLARYELWKDATSETVREGYEDAIKALEKISSGKVTLDIEAPSAAERGIQFNADPAPISPDDFKAFIG